jgi:hypothetical protein
VASLAALAALAAGDAPALQIGAIAFERGCGLGESGQGCFFEAGLGGGAVSGASVQGVRVQSQLGTGLLELAPISAVEFAATRTYASRDDLLAAFPDGNVTLTLTLSDASVVSGQLLFAPGHAPAGGFEILAVTPGETFADLAFENHCASCRMFNQGVGFGPTSVSLTLTDLDDPGSTPTRQLIDQDTASFHFGSLAEKTRYRAQTAVAALEFSTPLFGGAPTSYFQISTEVRSADFVTTPEPSPLLLLGAGLLALRRRRRR